VRPWAIAAALVLACDGSGPGHVSAPSSAPPEVVPDAAARLAAYEDERRASFDPLTRRPWSAAAGDDPFAIAALDEASAIGVLRGRDAIVLLDRDGVERSRVDGPHAPSSVAIGPDGAAYVVGARGEVVRVARDGEALGAPTPVVLPGITRGRELVAAPWGLLATDCGADRVLAFPRSRRGAAGTAAFGVTDCGGPIGLAHGGGLVAAVCLFDRGLALTELDASGTRATRSTRVVHDGPWWSATVVARGDGWIVAGGGVEDHPLDRSDGSFGYVDPHVFVLSVTRCGDALCAERLAAINVGSWGVVTPKWVGVELVGDAIALTITGYGGERMTRVELLADGTLGPPTHRTVAPGLRQLARVGDGWLGANPLLDRWVRIEDDGDVRLAAPSGPAAPRDPEVRVGEALFFTALLAPGADSAGQRSRFTCETCHFEGTVDGRVHFTGREDIHAATKPLLGLFVNRPHFSRALDRTLAVMVDNEFDVANRGSPQGPQFSVSPASTPWLAVLGVDAPMGPEALRRAFMSFFVAFDHEPSPAVFGRTELTVLEREGARLFAEHCESCHQARTITDDATTRVDPSRWPSLVLSPVGPLVWASETRVRTGVTPYVHPEGARVTSLRRLAIKRPYFTNGSARTLEEVLAGVRLRPDFAHAGGDAAAGLDAEARRALLAFLVLL